MAHRVNCLLVLIIYYFNACKRKKHVYDSKLQSSFLKLLFAVVVGVCIAEPFLKLPSKRYASTYYKEIKNPLSLFQIRKKLCVSMLQLNVVSLN